MKAEATIDQGLELSEFQERVMVIPEVMDIVMVGGRGGGKSYTAALLILRHCEQYGDNARVLFVRQSFPGTKDFENLTRDLFGKVYS